jgi:hypothetical protein
MIRYLVCIGLALGGILSCESAFETDEYDAGRAEYCDGGGNTSRVC